MIRHARGFTLLEMLVAIGIFALVSAIAYGALNQVLRVRAHIEAEREHWRQLALTFLRLEEDLGQFRERGVRSVSGTTLPAFVLQPTDTRALGEPSLEFTRGGRLLVADDPRSDLQRVAWRLSDGKLWRLSWAALDRAPGSLPDESPLLEGVESFSVRAWLASGWGNIYPPLGGGAVPAAPRGIEVTIALKNRGEYTRLFYIHD